jgi:hypothetical protein
MGVLGQQQRASGLDASGLARMLDSQRDNIAHALPPGFANYLSGTGILDGLSGTVAKDWAPPSRDYASSGANWVLPAIAVVALGALAWYLFSGTPTHDTTANAPQANVEGSAQAPGGPFTVTADEATTWIGRPVYGRDNKKIGEVVEIQRGPDDKLAMVYVDTGTFLGMGETRYRVDAHQVKEMRPDGMVLIIDEQQVKALPQEDAKPKP